MSWPAWVCAIVRFLGLHRATPILGEHIRLREAIAQLHNELTEKKNG